MVSENCVVLSLDIDKFLGTFPRKIINSFKRNYLVKEKLRLRIVDKIKN